MAPDAHWAYRDALGDLQKALYVWSMNHAKPRVHQETKERLFQELREAAAKLAGYEAVNYDYVPPTVTRVVEGQEVLFGQSW